MESRKIVELVLNNKVGEIECPDKLHPLALFLWNRTIKSIESISNELVPVSLSEKELERTINLKLDLINKKSVSQIQKYEEFIANLIEFKL